MLCGRSVTKDVKDEDEDAARIFRASTGRLQEECPTWRGVVSVFTVFRHESAASYNISRVHAHWKLQTERAGFQI